jgi:hypothetical protein
MRTVAAALVGVGLIVAAFGLGRVTRADAGAPVVAPRATPAPLAPGAPVSATGLEAARAIPALRPKPKPKRKKATTTTRTAAPSSSGTTAAPAPTAAPAAPRPSTQTPPAQKKQPSPRPVEEIG